MTKNIVLFGIVYLAIVSNNAYAVEFTYGLFELVEYSDNIRRVPGDESIVRTTGVVGPEKESETIFNTGLLMGVYEATDSLDMTADLYAVYQDYKNDIYEDRYLGTLDAYANWIISPQRLNWYFEDYFRNVVVNTDELDTPENRENTNIFITGPDLTLSLGQRQEFVIGGRYVNNYYQEGDADNERVRGHAILRFRKSPVTTFELMYRSEMTRFIEEDAGVDFWLREYSLGAERLGPTSLIGLRGGYSIIEREELEDLTGYTAELRLDYAMTPQSRFTMRGLGGYTDAGGALLADAGEREAVIDAEGNVVTQTSGALFYRKRAEAEYRYLGHFSETSIGGYYEAIEYEEEALLLDERISGGYLTMRLLLGPSTAIRLLGDYRKIVFLDENVSSDDQRQDELYNYEASMEYLLRRDWRMEGGYRRRTSTSNIDALNYVENRVFISLTFEFGRT